MKKKIITAWMLFLWTFAFFIPIFTQYSNCWYWSIWKKITKGGRVIPIPSKRWGGHHWIWEDKDKVQWEYNLKDYHLIHRGGKWLCIKVLLEGLG